MFFFLLHIVDFQQPLSSHVSPTLFSNFHPQPNIDPGEHRECPAGQERHEGLAGQAGHPGSHRRGAGVLGWGRVEWSGVEGEKGHGDWDWEIDS